MTILFVYALAMNESSRPSTVVAWAQLVRLPNVFTVIADVGAAFLLVAGGPYPINRLVLILLSGVTLYWAGMILNDVFDIDRDRQERPSRPLAAGNISLAAAKRAGWILWLLGVAIGFVCGPLPGAIALALAVHDRGLRWAAEIDTAGAGGDGRMSRS